MDVRSTVDEPLTPSSARCSRYAIFALGSQKRRRCGVSRSRLLGWASGFLVVRATQRASHDCYGREEMQLPRSLPTGGRSTRYMLRILMLRAK